MDSKNIFAAIEESGRKLGDAISQMTKRGLSAAKDVAGDPQWNRYIEELGYDAQECKQILSSPGLPRMQRFLTAYREQLEKGLKECTLAEKPQQALVYAAKLDVLDMLINRPERIIKDFEKAKKK